MSKENISAINNHPLFLERRTSELEKESSIGAIVIIVGIDPNKDGLNASNPALWTIVEKNDKPETEKIAGQISFPADTRKIGETNFLNILGALPEFSKDNEVIKKLVFMNSYSSYVEGKIFVNNRPADLAVLLINKLSDSSIVPLDSDEVNANGWMSLEDLKNIQKVNPSRLRNFVGKIIDMEESDKIIYKAVEDYFNYPEKRTPFVSVFSSDIFISQFYKNRERLADVVGNSGTIYKAKK